MPFTLTAIPNSVLPGAVNLIVSGDPNVTSTIMRVDGVYSSQPVRNYTTTGPTGNDTTVDCEAPLGRPVSYNLIRDTDGALLAQSDEVTCDSDPQNRSLVRSVIRPQVAWSWVTPEDETGVQWNSSTSVHEVVGQDTPVIIGEIRQRHHGVFSVLCKTIQEADSLVMLLRDGTPILIRHSPCAGRQTRDLLFYAKDVRETRRGRNGWRTILIDYQSTAFVKGETDEPALVDPNWNFGALRDAAADFATLMTMWPNFIYQSYVPKGPGWPALRETEAPALVPSEWGFPL